MIMKKGIGRRKGIFTSVSVLLLSMCLIMLAAPLSYQSGSGVKTATALLNMDKTESRYANLEGQAVRIFKNYIGVEVNNDSATISEILPLSPALSGDLESFIQFEKNLSEMNFSMNLSGMKNGSFYIMPFFTRVRNEPGGFFITPIGAGAQIAEYQLNLVFPIASVDNADWDVLDNATNSSGGLLVNVDVRDDSYSMHRRFYEYVNREGTSRINITSGGALVGYVEFSSGSAVEVHYEGNLDLKALTKFTTPVYVEANDTLSVISEVNKSRKIRIA